MQYSIVMKKQLNDEFRLDAEYYHPYNLMMVEKIKQKPWEIIGDFANVTDGIHASIDFDDDSKINLISAKSPKNNFFDLNANGYISEIQHRLNPRTELKVDDVIISTVGTIGNCATVESNIIPSNSDRHVGIIRIHSLFKPRFLSTFLLSKYGLFQSVRNITGNVQPNLFIYAIKKFLVSKLDISFQTIIEDIIFISHKKMEDGKLYLKEADAILLEQLKLQNWKPIHKLHYVKNFSYSISNKRFDAEYFQPQYDDIINAVKNYRGCYDTARSILNIKDKNYNPADVEYKYVELADIGSYGEITGCTKDIGTNLPTRARRKIATNDVIISSIEGSLSSIAVVNKEYNASLCSTGFYVVNSNDINSETLLVFFKSIAGQMQLKRGCSGTILTAINKEAFGDILIPKFSEDSQKSIKNAVQIAFKERHTALSMLEIAKTAVELAIETNEEKATSWIIEELQKIGVEYDARSNKN